MRRFYEKYDGQTPEQSLQTLVTHMELTPLRAAVIFRSVRPQASLDEFTKFMTSHLPAAALAREDLPEMYDKYGIDKFNLNDRGYLAHIHPLELWMLKYKQNHPNAKFGELAGNSAVQRKDVYSWLHKTRYKHAQDKRIETLLEIDAFEQIHRA